MGLADGDAFGTIAVNGSGWTDAAATLSSKPTGTGRLYVTSTGGVVLDSLTFAGNGVADAMPPTVSATLNPATPNGANGWYTSNVTVTINATDNGTVASRQRSTDGGVTWVNANNGRDGLDRGHRPPSSTGPPTTAATSRRSGR